MAINLTPIEDVLVTMPNTVYGLNIAWATTATFTVSLGYTRDSTNVFDIIVDANNHYVSSSKITVSSATVGVNGLDTGTLAASTVYAVYVIGSSQNRKAAAVVFSASFTAPTLPVGYDIYRRIGVITTSSGSAFLKAYQFGNAGTRIYQYDDTISVLAPGTSATYAAIDMSAAVPAIANTPVMLNTFFTPNAAADAFHLRPTGSSDTDGLALGGPVAGKESAAIIQMIAGIGSSKAEIDYKVAASGSLVVDVIGFVDSI